MQFRNLIIYPIVAALGLAGRPVAAQIDYRNLDEGRPLRTEDAYPVERYAFELVLGYGYESEADHRSHLTAPELSWGLLDNAMAGVQLPMAALDDAAAGGTDWGFGGPRLFGFYNFNTEGSLLPALALRADVALPFGDLAGDDARVGLTAIATRSWGRTRAHLNGTVGLGGDAGSPVHGVPEWAASVAVDRTFLRRSLLAGAELAARQSVPGGPTEASVALGARMQVSPTLVLDAGIERRLTGDAGPDLGLTVGLSHAFAIGGLMPRGGRKSAETATGPGAATDPNAGAHTDGHANGHAGGPAGAVGPSAAAVRAAEAAGALDPRDEQFYYPGDFNWRFLRTFPEAARLFNAFDYGHAVLYERLLNRRSSEARAAALAKEYRYLTRELLVRPPRFAVAEEAVMPDYAKLAWRAKQMFDWAHILHRQIYDAYADERLTPAARDSLIERLTDYYLSRRDVAFTAVPKSMALMDEQPFSQVFRREHAKFNGLIWAYHWLQVGLYEPLIAGETTPERKQRVQATVARFWEMVQREEFPTAMPMTSAIAPEFSRRHPRAAVIFDNLHMMHDIISDVLASPDVPPERKREVIYAQLEEFRDPATNVISMEAWRTMADHMGGVDAMGGPALNPLATPRESHPGHDAAPAPALRGHQDHGGHRP